MRCDKRGERFRQGCTDVSVFSCALVNDGPSEERFAGFRVRVGRFVPEGAMALIFRSEWGREMTPLWQAAAGTDMAVTAGRSSHGWSPFLFIREAAGAWLWVGLAWPGNWRLTLTAEGEIFFGMDGAMLSGTLQPGETLPLPRALIARAADFNTLRRDVCRFLRTWLPPTRMDPSIVSWNPWWRYEDCEINEDIVLANARAAKELGLYPVVRLEDDELARLALACIDPEHPEDVLENIRRQADWELKKWESVAAHVDIGVDENDAELSAVDSRAMALYRGERRRLRDVMIDERR